MAKLKAIRGDGRLAQFAPLFGNRLLQRTATLILPKTRLSQCHSGLILKLGYGFVKRMGKRGKNGHS